MSAKPSFIRPDWPAPANVHAVVTTRTGGVSRAPYDSFNLAAHVGDDPDAVRANRARLRESLYLPGEPVWLRQVHGIAVIDASKTGAEPEADGAFAARPGAVCAALTADCLPVFLCDRSGTCVAVLHAGWRGLVAGVIEQGVTALGVPGSELLAWLGPAIGPQAFEVGPEVRDAFVRHDPRAMHAFRAGQGSRYFADIYQLARLRLAHLGVGAVSGGDFCTVMDRARFYSYRRDGVCGRMASLIWLDAGG
jgi:YfiH family protein